MTVNGRKANFLRISRRVEAKVFVSIHNTLNMQRSVCCLRMNRANQKYYNDKNNDDNNNDDADDDCSYSANDLRAFDTSNGEALR